MESRALSDHFLGAQEGVQDEGRKRPKQELCAALISWSEVLRSRSGVAARSIQGAASVLLPSPLLLTDSRGPHRLTEPSIVSILTHTPISQNESRSLAWGRFRLGTDGR